MAKKYYWMKLKEDFFDDDTIEWLEEQPKGKEYALFYLKLCLKSLKTNGLLIRAVGSILVPYDNKKLAEMTKTDFDTTVVAMELLKNIGLVEILEGGEICLPRMEEMIGSETDKAAIMRKNREQKRIMAGNNVTEALPENGSNNVTAMLPESSSNNVTETLPESYPCKEGNNVTETLPKSSENVTQRLEIRDKEIRDKKIVVGPCVQRPPQGVPEKHPRIGAFEFQCVDILVESCLALFPNSKVPKTEAEREKWAIEFERMKRLDHRTESEIVEALTFATTDPFWKTNIRSAKKFREKFETLLLQSRGKKRGHTGYEGENNAGAGSYYREQIAKMEEEIRAKEEPVCGPEIQ